MFTRINRSGLYRGTAASQLWSIIFMDPVVVLLSQVSLCLLPNILLICLYISIFFLSVKECVFIACNNLVTYNG